MKKINVKTFEEWIDKVYPEIAIIPCEDGMSFLSLAGYDGPSFSEHGIETECGEISWDQYAKEIEWKAKELLDCPESETIDFREEYSALLDIAKRVREKLKTLELGTPEENEKDLYRGVYPNGEEFFLLPFTENNLDEINEIVSLYLNDIMEDPDSKERQSFMDFVKED